MAIGIKPYMISMVLSIIFFIALVNWQNGLAVDNNSPQTILNSSYTSASLIAAQGAGTNNTGDSNVIFDAYVNSSQTISAGNIIPDATPGIGLRSYVSPKAYFDILSQFIANTLFSGPQRIVWSIIAATFGILIILYLIKLWRLGTPD